MLLPVLSWEDTVLREESRWGLSAGSVSENHMDSKSRQKQGPILRAACPSSPSLLDVCKTPSTKTIEGILG